METNPLHPFELRPYGSLSLFGLDISPNKAVVMMWIIIVLASRRPRAGLVLTVWGLAWSVLAITVIIPHFNPQHHYYYWKDGGVAGSGGPFSPASLLAQPTNPDAELLPH